MTELMVRRSIQWSILAGGLSVALGASSPVLAQPGDHVRIGDAELIPSVIIGSHYRSNVYLFESDERSGVALLVSPEAALELDGEELELKMGAGYHLRKYLGSEISNLDRFKDGNFALDVSLLPSKMLGFDLSESLTSSSRETEAWYAESALINHFSNDLAGALAFHPGGALEAEAGGHFDFDDYKVPEGSNIERNANYNSRIAYGPSGQFKWRFFPRTALVLNASMDWFKWNNNLVNIQPDAGQTTTEFGSYLGMPDGTLFAVSGGLRGRFTERVALGLVLGYNKAVYDEQTVIDDGANEPNAAGDLDPVASRFGTDSSGLDNLLASASIEYSLSETHRVAIGFDRAMQDSYFTNYVLHNYVFLRYNVMLGTRFGVGAEGGFSGETFRGEVARTDFVVRTRLNTTYAANDWLAIGAGVWWDRRASADGIASIEYDDVTASLTATLTY